MGEIEKWKGPVTEFLIIPKWSQRYSELIFTFLHLYISNEYVYSYHSARWETARIPKTNSLVNAYSWLERPPTVTTSRYETLNTSTLRVNYPHHKVLTSPETHTAAVLRAFRT